MGKDQLNVAVVGLGFGAKFVPLFLDRPGVESVSICDTDAERLGRVADICDVRETFTDVEEVLTSREIDAVYLAAGIPDHAKHTLAVLESGKHCACAVPMATAIEDVQAIVALRQKTGLNYMMMETSVYTRPFFYAMELMAKGESGRVQFLRGAHYQDMEGFTIYGENACYEWRMEDEDPMLFRMSSVVPGKSRSLTGERPEPPDRADRRPVSRYKFGIPPPWLTGTTLALMSSP